MSKKTPQIRFKGFTDDWEERKLNEVSDIYDGTHQTPKYQDNGVMFLSVENIKTLTSNKFISREAFEDEFKIRPQRGDVLMTRIGDIGTANVVETDEDLAYYVSLALFKSEELNPYFLQASIYAPFVQDQIWKRTLHIAFPKKINKNEIGQVPINVPTLAEQTKIGSFFKQIDDTIDLHQRKLDLLKEQKKGFLQKMFPKNGSRVPELRFAGFADYWEERKLQEVLRERNNQQPQSMEYPLVSFTVENGVTPKTDRYEREQLVVGDKSSKKYKVTVLNDIVYNPANLKFGAISRNKYGNAVFSPIYITFLVNNDVTTPEFIEMFVTRNDFIKRALKYQQGTVYERQSVSPTDLLAMNVYLPGKSEQEKIGSFFKQLDDTIALHQRKLDLLTEQKKGFLQKMFVS
ncbi:restriction endonuclease subunit S [Leuconostoc lactis]|uniref:restriction endonuclease subunit S n=1 Tax=Leuconostoc lactis TaxID=1246 RepID=UPI0015F3FB77|nr:restriction endonuclease subunit S [Leuconostoc lactis]MBA5813339.1 restriction endonuclease subunit S [Leuconostoc lactis]